MMCRQGPLPSSSSFGRLCDCVDYYSADVEVAAEDGSRLTYAGLARVSKLLAFALTNAGLRAGDRVAFLGLPGLDFLTAYIAVMRAGGVWVGLNPKYKCREIVHVLKDADVRLVLVGSTTCAESRRELGLASALVRRPPPVVPFHRDAFQIPDLREALLPPLNDNVALIVYTSGTTGSPKGALLTHAGIIRAAEIYAARLGPGRFRALHNLPINHVGGLVDVVAPALLSGGSLVFMREFSPELIPEVINSEHVTIWGQVPVMFQLVDLDAALKSQKCSEVRTIIWSGASMPVSTFERLRRFQVEMMNCYGQTECTGSVTLTARGASDEVLLGTVGRPAEPDNFRLIAEGSQVTEPEAPGEIEVRGDLVMAGYHNDPTATAAVLSDDGWLRTGDLACWSRDGNIRLIGRVKEMFKSGGYNVYPREIELVIESHESVEMAAVIGIPDADWGEVGYAFVLSLTNVDPGALDAWCRQHLANYKVPKTFTIRRQLPLLPIGKLDKRALRAQLTQSDGRFHFPSGPVQHG